jgi:hypothetical protein
MEKARARIQWFIDNFNGENEASWVKDMMELAKAVLEKVH